MPRAAIVLGGGTFIIFFLPAVTAYHRSFDFQEEN